MDLIKKWCVYGISGSILGTFFYKVIAYMYTVIHAWIQFLPYITLAWVPGLDVLWAFVLVLGIGYVLSMEMFDSAIRCYMERLQKMLGARYEKKAITFTLDGKIFRWGYAYNKVRHQDKDFFVVALTPYHFMAYEMYLVPVEDVFSIEPERKHQPSGSKIQKIPEDI